MNHIKSIFLLGGLCLSLLGQAQTARWLMKPEYQRIDQFSETLYKVTTYNDMSLVDANGGKIVTADSITFLTNGYALALTSASDKYRITSIIDKDGKETKLKQELYYGDYSFFSEDKCAVVNKKGKYGFITPDGKLVIPCNYVSVHPFREGFASVCKVQKGLKGFLGAAGSLIGASSGAPAGPSIYIDAKGVEQKLSAEIGIAALASSFRNGQAIVQSQDNKTYTIDKMCKIVQLNTPLDNLKFDDYFALTPGVPERANQPYRPTYNYAYSVFTENNLKGYKANGTVMLPAQFEVALGFCSGCAIVKKGGKYGIIRQVNGSPKFNVTDKDGKLTVTGTVPAEFSNSQANFIHIINGSDKLSFAMEGMDSERKLETDVPNTGGTRLYEVDIDGLTIWQLNKVNYGVDDNVGGKPSGKMITVKAPAVVKANSKGECAVKVTVTNNSGSAQNIVVTLSTGGSKSIKLAAGKSGTVTITTKVVKELKCTVTGKCAAGSSSCSTTLKPSFIL